MATQTRVLAAPLRCEQPQSGLRLFRGNCSGTGAAGFASPLTCRDLWSRRSLPSAILGILLADLPSLEHGPADTPEFRVVPAMGLPRGFDNASPMGASARRPTLATTDVIAAAPFATRAGASRWPRASWRGLWDLLKETISNFIADEALSCGASIACYTLFATAGHRVREGARNHPTRARPRDCIVRH
jgi:hypothetical protein